MSQSYEKKNCPIVQDLLPLYVEHLTSEQTNAFIEDHIKYCSECALLLEKEKEGQNSFQTSAEDTQQKADLILLQKKLKTKRLQTILMSVLFCAALLICAFGAISSPIYSPFSKDLISIQAIEPEENEIMLTFNQDAADYSYEFYQDPENENIVYCGISAWSSLWNRWFSNSHQRLSALVEVDEDKTTVFVYEPNNGQINQPVAAWNGKSHAFMDRLPDTPANQTLPRIALNYYIYACGILFLLLALTAFLLRKHASLRLLLERLALAPLCYVIGQLLVSCFTPVTYSLQRDLFLGLMAGILFYGAASLALERIREKKEEKAAVSSY